MREDGEEVTGWPVQHEKTACPARRHKKTGGPQQGAGLFVSVMFCDGRIAVAAFLPGK